MGVPRMKRIISLLLVAFASSAYADLGEKIASFENWDIYRSQDSMTDKTECVAAYKANRRIQFTATSFAIGGLVWPEAYRYRIDSKKPSELFFNDDIGKKMGAIVIDRRQYYQEILGSDRFRMQVNTSSKTVDFDVNTSDLIPVQKRLLANDCK